MMPPNLLRSVVAQCSYGGRFMWCRRNFYSSLKSNESKEVEGRLVAAAGSNQKIPGVGSYLIVGLAGSALWETIRLQEYGGLLQKFMDEEIRKMGYRGRRR